jgi:PAS domain S-box-containing protein
LGAIGMTVDAAGGGKGRILVVDDTPANLRLLTKMLSEQGYVVHPASGGKPALRFLQFTLPDLILLDVVMPDIHGYQLCEQLKANERTRDIPVIFITASEHVLDKVKAFAVGGVDYITKPFNADEIGARIKTHLSLRELQKRLEQRVEERTAALIEANARLNEEILERRRAEHALRQSEERFRDYAEVASDWFWESGPDHRFTFVSDRIRGFGIDPERLVGRHRSDVALDREADPVKWRQHLSKLQRHEPFREFIFTSSAAGGSIRFVSASGRPIFDQVGKFLGYRGSSRDVTDAVLAARVLEEAKHQADVASQAKTAFLANMSHELRTPLNAVIGFSEIMAKELFGPLGNERYRGYVLDILASSSHLLGVISDILDMSKIEAGRFELADNPVDLGDAIRACVSLLQASADRGGVKVMLQLPTNLPRIRGDERAIKQVVLNLLSNGIKFTPSDGTVTIAAYRDFDGGLAVALSDTGSGIDEENIERVFAPFQQLDARSSGRSDGTGLGLTISKSFMELHGGQLTLRSELGRGTTAIARFPPKRVIRGDEPAPELAAPT